MYFIVDDSEVNDDESMETTTTSNETPEVRTVVLQYNLPLLIFTYTICLFPYNLSFYLP